MNNGGLLSPASEKRHKATWTRYLFLPIPGITARRLRILVPNTAALRYHFALFSSSSSLPTPRLRRKRSQFFACLACLALVLTILILSKGHRRHGGWSQTWSSSPNEVEPSTLVFQREDLQRVWKWEVASGHYPSFRGIPEQIAFNELLTNPAIPHRPKGAKPPKYRSTSSPDIFVGTHGVGSKRVYLDLQSQPPNTAYPPRPVPGSVADMDIIMKHCDFSQNKYVRDCLEVLRTGGGLDNGDRIRRGKMDDWHYIYLEQPHDDIDQDTLSMNTSNDTIQQILHPAYARTSTSTTNTQDEAGIDEANAGLKKKSGVEWEEQVVLPEPVPYTPTYALSSSSSHSHPACDPDNPRLFHMFWAGSFTDKPYLALLSFLFTQNTGIHLKEWPQDSRVCRPQFWLWINPGPAASVPNPSAVRDMYEQLKSNPWAAPFLHPRFKDIIHFKLWNTTEQLDGVPEIKNEWRKYRNSLFNSGGQVINVKPADSTTEGGNFTSSAAAQTEDDMTRRMGSKSIDTYDKLSVILSDMARFILCHRFGGIYLDADTLLLRDWEELWGWRGAFAYRWSRLPRYNTAVLRMNKGSALGTFLFRTALKNGLDFHPMTVSLYTQDAFLEGLLLRLPDALFDSAWLNSEDYQRDRPPQPFFTLFTDFFDTPARDGAAPQALGFRGFFRGAYSYHFHNFWWKPFDPARNWPDLGPRFKAGEDIARAALRKEKLRKLMATRTVTGQDTKPTSPTNETLVAHDEEEDKVENDKRDLDWSVVLKRTFEAYIRGERPNMYGEWLQW
ncbi:hypothetical protein AMATHDRAFT_73281 [Amanita thiersii Skay4041]|uniref:Glycosyltransferase family 32 protein n=1 Tax=Amanita thiersii Skay4041 TaxID=703135 RepID=A0A2A9NZJ8_9AGAR|nr:hypothetical protein AMATHDRAFT_73281 [Amanita thiersii Skay4041]